MSATHKTDFEVGSVVQAQVSFRVRCETLGHGEEVFLVMEGATMTGGGGIGSGGGAHKVRVSRFVATEDSQFKGWDDVIRGSPEGRGKTVRREFDKTREECYLVSVA
jgi:hypothetical protein